MKIKSFKAHLEKRLSKKEIHEIELAAKLEIEVLEELKQNIAMAVQDYMKENEIGFNELVRRLGKSPNQVSKIIKGDANLTLTTVAQIFAIMHRKPHLIY